MAALLSWVNWLDRAGEGVTIAASSEVATLRASRLVEPQLRRRWRTMPGATSPVLNIDLGAVRTIGVLALVQPDDAGGISPNNEALGLMAPSDTVRHRLDAVSPGAGALLDTAVLPGGWAAGAHAYVPAAPIAARYWRADLAAASLASAPGYVDLGRAWAGPAWKPARGNFSYGWGRVWEDGSTVSNNPRSGLDFVDVGPNRRALTFAFNVLTQADAAQLDELQRVAGIRGQVLFLPFEDRRIAPVLGRLVQVQPITQPNFVAFQAAFQIRQSL
ncbi:hypothetical protein [Roseococcus sp.]|uniref:hypothetical protein n=1 Tax=Roseococcus sp. TaxID=2109646 RepID=UPI003BABAF80